MPATAAPELHVHPHSTTGGWVVGPAWFATLSEAEQAARRQAATQGARIYLHDRYHRVRTIGGRRPGQP
jgi:hypothetical protein